MNHHTNSRRRRLDAPREDILREEVADALAATQEDRIEAMVGLLDSAYQLWAVRGFSRDQGLCHFLESLNREGVAYESTPNLA